MSVGLGKLELHQRKDTLCAKTTLAADTTLEVALIQVYLVGRKKIEATPQFFGQFFSPGLIYESFKNFPYFFPDYNVWGRVYNNQYEEEQEATKQGQ
jgi:hypothetical protein